MRPRPSESAAKEVERMHSGISTTLRNLFVDAALALGVGSATGQPTGPLEAAIEEGWTQPRTSWGAPDLQGIWNNTAWNAPPLQRQTEEDLREIERRRAAFARSGARGLGYDIGVWGEGVRGGRSQPPIELSHLVVDPADGRLPPLTPEAQARLNARREARRGLSMDEPRPGAWVEDVTVWMRCISRGLPDAMFPRLYNNNYNIMQTRDYIVIYYEMIHDARIIPLDGRPGLPEDFRQWNGDARAHWDGDTLVIETARFVGQEFNLIPHGGGGAGTYSGASKELRLTERFTRLSDDFIEYEFTIDDPGLYTRPWTGVIPLTTIESPDSIIEYACHEGNYSIVGALSGALARDRSSSQD